jgi:hypothetical protein
VDATYRLIAHDVADQPSLLVTGFGGSLAAHVASPYGLFSLVWYNPDDHILEDGSVVRGVMQAHGPLGIVGYWCSTLGVFSFLNAIAMGLAGAAFTLGVPVAAFRAWRRRATMDAETGMLLAAGLGVLLSAPFLPPWVTPSLQIQSTTMTFLAALPAVVFLGRRREVGDDAPSAALLRGSLATVVVGAALVLFVRLVPARPTPAAPCGDGRGTVRVLRDTEVELTDGRSTIHRKSMADLDGSMMFMRKHNGEVVASIERYRKPGTVVAYAYDACDASAKIVIDDTGVLARGDAPWTPLSLAPLEHPKIVHVAPPPP